MHPDSHGSSHGLARFAAVSHKHKEGAKHFAEAAHGLRVDAQHSVEKCTASEAGTQSRTHVHMCTFSCMKPASFRSRPLL
eukprot:359154-Chlamydomonas_euryale.AAC.3